MKVTSANSSNNGPVQENQKWYESTVFRILVAIIASSICTVLLVAGSYESQHNNTLAASILFALTPTIILALLFVIVQVFYENASRFQEQTRSLIRSNFENGSELKDLIVQLSELIENAATTLELYDAFRKQLDNDPEQRRLIRNFMHKSLNGPLFIWNIGEKDFNDLVIQGIKNCNKSWQGIHHGKISELQPFSYLQELKKVEKTQRIIILKQEDINETEDENKVTDFLKLTADTPSYWITEKEFFQISELSYLLNKIRLDDCALHDSKLLLHRQREIQLVMMSFKGEHEPICDGISKAFELLNLQLEGNPVPYAKFHEIVLPSHKKHESS
jgi:hypothetical protein